MYTFSTELFSDLHKDVYGFRPRQHWFYDTDTTDEERQKEWDYLIEQLDLQIEEDRKVKAQRLKALELDIAKNIALGAGNRQAAIRWIVQSLNPDHTDLMYGGEWVCYELGLDYSLAPMFSNACNELSLKEDA